MKKIIMINGEKFVKMNTMDRLFKELGYTKVMESDELAMFVKDNLEICFYKEEKTIGIYADSGESVYGNTIYDSVQLNFQEVQAIYLACRELGFEKE